jgi:hypothetical protein
LLGRVEPRQRKSRQEVNDLLHAAAVHDCHSSEALLSEPQMTFSLSGPCAISARSRYKALNRCGGSRPIGPTILLSKFGKLAGSLTPRKPNPLDQRSLSMHFNELQERRVRFVFLPGEL